MTKNDINRFIQKDKLKCLIVEATNESAYGFNLSIDVEEAAALSIVNQQKLRNEGGLQQNVQAGEKDIF